MERSEQFRSYIGDHRCEGGNAEFRCEGCGKSFENPLFATVLSNGNVQQYYACPRCMTKVNKADAEAKEEPRITVNTAKRSFEKSATEAGCSHFVGYLNKRPKNMPIPDECLTCGKMVECLLH
ncbi:hypothetical protein KEJ15_00985 [Candidatus Bathyarchaeota archaeon]|nr:hypothetical protein [Candidatus Bathyarchaeota archaeon]